MARGVRPGSALWQMSLTTFAWFNEHIEPVSRVLDFGSGSGAGTARLHGIVTGVLGGDRPGFVVNHCVRAHKAR